MRTVLMSTLTYEQKADIRTIVLSNACIGHKNSLNSILIFKKKFRFLVVEDALEGFRREF